MTHDRIECEFAIGLQFDNINDLGLIHIGIQTKRARDESVTGIHLFTARRKHAAFFRELADKLDALPE